mmetsp:Transcript_36119/g.84392  ORF Transcript_36119/g.84392 Transcript_36119/m.84392 type:complete len:86 (-) Transcript_36119:296-553(-)
MRPTGEKSGRMVYACILGGGLTDPYAIKKHQSVRVLTSSYPFAKDQNIPQEHMGSDGILLIMPLCNTRERSGQWGVGVRIWTKKM